ncbi:MAG: recombinase family protein [Dehalococcoidia bacterium]
MGNGKVAAIWWRVSTDDQREISPDTQIREASALAKQEGYEVPEEYVLGTDWHSLSVWESPPMERLKELVRSRAIQGLFMYEPDRGPSKPVHRLLFRALCEEHGVTIRCRYGQVPDGDMGEVMEFLSAWSKEKQVLRAQQGARDGLRDRALLKGLPAGGPPPYGYRWVSEGQIKRLVACDEFPIVVRIWRCFLQGHTLRRIAADLTKDGAPTARGGGRWSPSTIHAILVNPVYSGQCVAQRFRRETPLERRGNTYGKSSRRTNDASKWIVLKSVVVDLPIVTAQEYNLAQFRLRDNFLASRRKAHREYLLRRMVKCANCLRMMSPTWHQKAGTHLYRCTVCGQNRRGPKLEEEVWQAVSAFLSNPAGVVAEMETEGTEREAQRQRYQEELHRLERRLEQCNSREAGLYRAFSLDEQPSEEALRRNLGQLRAERTWAHDEMERVRRKIASLDHITLALQELEATRRLIHGRLQDATPVERRFVLTSLEARVLVRKGRAEVEVAVPGGLTETQEAASYDFYVRNATPL